MGGAFPTVTLWVPLLPLDKCLLLLRQQNGEQEVNVWGPPRVA